jgi:hypothetical protein
MEGSPLKACLWVLGLPFAYAAFSVGRTPVDLHNPGNFLHLSHRLKPPFLFSISSRFVVYCLVLVECIVEKFLEKHVVYTFLRPHVSEHIFIRLSYTTEVGV